MTRFWAKVDKDGPVPEHLPELGHCWVWTACKDGAGYGRFRWRGLNRAHRASWVIHNGSLCADRPHVLHYCDNPSCVNPAHLWVGTNDDNVADRQRKGRGNCGRGDRHGSFTRPERVPRGDRHGRHTKPERTARGERHNSQTRPETVPRGERHGNAKLTTEYVREIRLRAASESHRQLGRSLGVSHTTIRNILCGKAWAHVT